MIFPILHPLVNLVQWLPSVERVTLRQKLTSAHYPKMPYQNQHMLNENCIAVYHVARPCESSFFFSAGFDMALYAHFWHVRAETDVDVEG